MIGGLAADPGFGFIAAVDNLLGCVLLGWLTVRSTTFPSASALGRRLPAGLEGFRLLFVIHAVARLLPASPGGGYLLLSLGVLQLQPAALGMKVLARKESRAQSRPRSASASTRRRRCWRPARLTRYVGARAKTATF